MCYQKYRQHWCRWCCYPFDHAIPLRFERCVHHRRGEPTGNCPPHGEALSDLEKVEGVCTQQKCQISEAGRVREGAVKTAWAAGAGPYDTLGRAAREEANRRARDEAVRCDRAEAEKRYRERIEEERVAQQGRERARRDRERTGVPEAAQRLGIARAREAMDRMAPTREAEEDRRRGPAPPGYGNGPYGPRHQSGGSGPSSSRRPYGYY